MMRKILSSAVISAALALSAQVAVAEDKAQAPPAAQPEMNAAMKAEVERQFYVGMIALKDYCKQINPDQLAAFDESWTKNTADVPTELQTLAKTPEFAAKVTARVNELGESSKTPAAAAEIKAACAMMIAKK